MVDQKLRCGILIIGSLYWQDDLKPGDRIRKKWRQKYLSMNKAIDVKVPIRYGRLSGNEEQGDLTYTMIIDNSLPKDRYGTAKAVPIIEETITFSELFDFVRATSKAEGGNSATFIKGKKKPWCVCGLLINPSLDDELKFQLLNEWKKKLMENREGYESFKSNTRAFSMDEYGRILFHWPENLKSFDVLIATSTEAKSAKEISSKEIAKYTRNRPYFHPNRECGIVTYQDDSIITAEEGDEHG